MGILKKSLSKTTSLNILMGAGKKYTNVPLLPSFVAALAGGSITIALAYLLKESLPYLYSLIMERGPVQFITIYAFWFTFGMLIFKFKNIKKERSAFRLDFIKNFTKGRDVVGTKTILEEQVNIEENQDPQYKDLILVNRINKAIKQLSINRNPSDVANILKTVGETDAAIMDSSYVLIKFMIWAIPVMGFIGTIVGMIRAIGSFDAVLKGVGEVGFSGVKQSLGQVTGGLSVAFETTFLALVLSIIINLFSNALQKKEEDLLSDVEEFTTDNIINKYSHLRSRLGYSTMPEETSQPPGDETEFHSSNILMELKNMNKQNQVNADQMMAQIGHLIETLQGMPTAPKGEAAPTVPGNELQPVLRQMSDVLKSQAEFMKTIEKLPAVLEDMKETNRKLGELFSKIYNRTFS